MGQREKNDKARSIGSRGAGSPCRGCRCQPGFDGAAMSGGEVKLCADFYDNLFDACRTSTRCPTGENCWDSPGLCQPEYADDAAIENNVLFYTPGATSVVSSTDASCFEAELPDRTRRNAAAGLNAATGMAVAVAAAVAAFLAL